MESGWRFWLGCFHYVDELVYMVTCPYIVVEDFIPVARIGSVFG